MNIGSVKYVGTVVKAGDPPPGTLPQVAFSGRSNVGKSSLINTLLRRTRSKVARVSATPGKTQALNFYEVNEHFYLVDLPGYGFAKVPESVRKNWAKLIEDFLAGTAALKGVVHLVDARHPPTRHDRDMLAYLGELRTPTLVVLNKIDKLSRSERAASIERARGALGVDEAQLVVFSSKTGEGREALLEAMDELLSDGRSDEPELNALDSEGASW